MGNKGPDTPLQILNKFLDKNPVHQEATVSTLVYRDRDGLAAAAGKQMR